MDAASDPRLRRFVRGELSPEEIAELEAELDRRPSLSVALAACARALANEAEPSAPARPSERPSQELVVGPPLGEGGMSHVRQGVQPRLGRAVAVKMLRDDTPSGTHRLLQEARLTARLQHPNIVPVHDVTHARDGGLQLVLKQVEGVPWSSVMGEPELLRARYGASDPLEWNLAVLVAICNALSYAHERGVVHRDVKPSNVMIGTFGEVYLLDWGIAALWGDASDPEVAHVADNPFAGTRAYMSPEQLDGDSEAVGPWTDVYLLGATLYQVLAGRPPHAEAAAARLHSSARVVAPLPPEAPRELASLVEEAMERAPEDRPLSASAFRARLEAFRQHRSSFDLVAGAERALAAATERAVPGAREAALAEAEFGFRAALAVWTGNLRAQEGLRAIATARIEDEIAAGHLDRAGRLLEGLDDASPALHASLARARADEAALAVSPIARWRREATVGAVTRAALLLAYAPLWIFGWGAIGIWPPSSRVVLVLVLAGYLAVGTALVLVGRRALLENHVNRANVLAAGIATGAALAWALAAEALAVDLPATEAGILLAFAIVPAVFAVTSDPRAYLPATVNFGCFVVAAAIPSRGHQALAASALLGAGSLLLNNVLLRRRGAAPDQAVAREGRVKR